MTPSALRTTKTIVNNSKNPTLIVLSTPQSTLPLTLENAVQSAYTPRGHILVSLFVHRQLIAGLRSDTRIEAKPSSATARTCRKQEGISALVREQHRVSSPFRTISNLRRSSLLNRPTSPGR